MYNFNFLLVFNCFKNNETNSAVEAIKYLFNIKKLLEEKEKKKKNENKYLIRCYLTVTIMKIDGILKVKTSKTPTS